MAANPVLLQWLAYFGATALLLGIGVLAALDLWRAINDKRPLLLAEMLALEGIDMAAQATGTGARQFALAASRCVECGVRGRCEAWLAGRSAGSYRAFCPNAGYIARLKLAGR